MKKKYPLLNLLILIQAGSFFLGAILIFFVIRISSKSEMDSKISALKNEVGSAIEHRQEEWRVWKYMDLNDALGDEIASFQKTYPIKSIRVDKRDALSALVDDENLIFPKDLDPALDLAVLANIDTSSVPTVDANHKLALLTTLIFAALFAIMVLTSFFYISRRIYMPIMQMNHAMERIAADGALNVDRIHAVGEIKDFIDKFKEMYDKTKEAEVHRAIAVTLQMFAHDVRKPFSVLKMSLLLLSKVKNLSELAQLISKITPEVDRAMTSVGGMINDVMEIGRTSEPHCENVDPEALIECSLVEVIRVHETADITFRYDLQHSHSLFVDQLKVGRVFSNIFANAVQATKGRGQIWVSTREEAGMITFCLGNEGSFISPDDLPCLFEAFFTKNKKGGTGLGLAIAKKAVKSHGGEIWCESSAEQKTVEFFFTLPIGTRTPVPEAYCLPLSSKSIVERFKRPLMQVVNSVAIDESVSAGSSSSSDKDYEAMIIAHAKKLGRSLKVAIIDDEIIYRNALTGLIDSSEVLRDVVTVESFAGSQDLLTAFVGGSYDYLICDIDLGVDSLNGYDIVKALRDHGHKTAICIHSNRSLPEDFRRSIEVGAQAFLPKPLSRFHLLRFMGTLDAPS